MDEKIIKNNEKVLGIITEKVDHFLNEIVSNRLYYYTPYKREYDVFPVSNIDTTDFKKYLLNMLMEKLGKVEMEEKIHFGDGFTEYKSGICELDLESEAKKEKEREKPKGNLFTAGLITTVVGFGTYKWLKNLSKNQEESLKNQL